MASKCRTGVLRTSIVKSYLRFVAVTAFALLSTIENTLPD